MFGSCINCQVGLHKDVTSQALLSGLVPFVLIKGGKLPVVVRSLVPGSVGALVQKIKLEGNKGVVAGLDARAERAASRLTPSNILRISSERRA